MIFIKNNSIKNNRLDFIKEVNVLNIFLFYILKVFTQMLGIYYKVMWVFIAN